MKAQYFNKTYPVGTQFKYFPVKGNYNFEIVRTSSPAWDIPSSRHALVKLSGRSGGVCVSHLKVN
ncbi:MULTISPECIES: hypothetical protein [unclassified Alteromonas]|jgi:hypothetical protein|uniref:hypothetical protein n=1 Tax=unclassified Alteromonas TaxID=2614992 RepID=UPI0012E6457A|nr:MULTISPECIES: hypothetical protein [unclassified Alteromonas]GFD68079.1 hypothetical protein KUL106_13420 [Alteromonas sp. KUL106]GFD85081.1 hypothetical protein KUL150_11400 [Alteromonas sp. KUL150]